MNGWWMLRGRVVLAHSTPLVDLLPVYIGGPDIRDDLTAEEAIAAVVRWGQTVYPDGIRYSIWRPSVESARLMSGDEFDEYDRRTGGLLSR